MASSLFSPKECCVVAAVLATLALLLITQNPTAAQVTLLDFEDLPAGTSVTTQYGERGVLSPRQAFIVTHSAASSGSRVLRAGDLTDEFHSGPLVLEFTSGQTRVRVLAGTTLAESLIDGTLRAFDADGNLIARDGPKPVARNAFVTAFEVSVTEPAIRRVELRMGTTEFEAIDDLEFEGERPPDLPTEPPVVQITSPPDAAELDTSALTVQGTVTGEGLLSSARLTVTQGLPPDSTAPPSTSVVFLEGSGTTRTFAQARTIGLGPHVMTVEAENSAGLKGSATVRFVNLPEPIRIRFAAEGGAASFGELRYGGIAGGCRMAVYQQGAIAAIGATTFVVRGDIFSKWFSLRDPGAPFARLGCPTGEERDAPGGARAQDFTQGRIYAGLPTGTHYVPAVFVQAIDQLGGEAATGVPIGDPSDSIGVMQTWLFQQFRRPDRPVLLPSTLGCDNHWNRYALQHIFVHMRSSRICGVYGQEAQ